MSQTLPRLEGPGDAELISAVRSGDVDAYGHLFSRHVGAARRLARQLVAPGDADDLVSEAFAKVLGVLQRGGGPDLAFRAYLLTAVRRLHVDRVRAASHLHTTGDLTPFDAGVPFRDTTLEAFETDAAARAFASLPERWQVVLWHTEVEGQRPAEVAVLLGMSPGSVSALAYRAREGLRQAFVSMHAPADDDRPACAWARRHLGSYLRRGLSRRDRLRIEEHLGGCRPCAAVRLELGEENARLAGLIGPAVLGGAAASYVGGVGATGGGGVGLGVLLGRLRDLVLASAPVPTTSGVMAGVTAGVAASAVVAGGAVLGLPGPGAATAAHPLGAGEPTAVTAVSGTPSADPVARPGTRAQGRTASGVAATGALLIPAGTASGPVPGVPDPGSPPPEARPTTPPSMAAPSSAAPSDPALSDPALSDPALSDPAPSPAATEPAPSDPGPSDPGPSDPGPSDPGPSDPGPSDPGPSDPASDAGPSDPGPSDPGPRNPGPPIPGSSGAGSSSAGTHTSGTQGPETHTSGTQGPGTHTSGTQGLETHGPGTHGPGTHASGVAASGTHGGTGAAEPRVDLSVTASASPASTPNGRPASRVVVSISGVAVGSSATLWVSGNAPASGLVLEDGCSATGSGALCTLAGTGGTSIVSLVAGQVAHRPTFLVLGVRPGDGAADADPADNIARVALSD